jgi:hypothetical protein
MINYFRKDSLLRGARNRAFPISRNIARGAVLAASLAALAVSASAQSYASSNGSINYSFALDPNSSGLGSSLVVTDQGESVYNLVNSSGQPYTSTSGSGNADAIPSSDTIFNGYNPSTGSWTGYNGIFSDAYETGTTGTAIASVGSEEFVTVENIGTAPITIDVTAVAYCFGSVSVTGNSSPTNYANSETDVDVLDYDYDNDTYGNPYVIVSGSASTGLGTYYTPEWTPLNPIAFGPGAYSLSYQMTVAGDGLHALEFYTRSYDSAVANAVPSPSGILALSVGLLGLMCKRRKRAM